MKFIKNLMEKAKAVFSRQKSLSKDQIANADRLQAELSKQVNRAERVFKVQRFFYRNAGLNRQETNHLHGQLKTATGERREMIKKILGSSPKNIPYVRGQKIHPQHAGIATPESLIMKSTDKVTV